MTRRQERWRQPQRLASGGALAGVAAGLFILGGLPGAVFGLIALTSWLVAPPVFAAAFAQAGLAAVATPPYSGLVLGVEVLLLVAFMSDPALPVSGRSRVLGAASIIAIGSSYWLVRPQPAWIAALGCLAVLTALLYGVHRYELLSTSQLEQ